MDADLSDGITPGVIASAMRDSGWALTALDVSTHAIHAIPGRTRSQSARKRDAALTVRERMMDEVERRLEAAEVKAAKETAACEHEHVYANGDRMHAVRIHDPAEYFDVLDKDIQGALGTILKAQGLQEKREARDQRNKIDMYQLMLGGPDGQGMLAPPELRMLDDGNTVDGEFEEVE